MKRRDAADSWETNEGVQAWQDNASGQPVVCGMLVMGKPIFGDRYHFGWSQI
jgi:hypothetical protein